MSIDITPSAREIVFVDGRVEDAGSLLHDLPPGAEIVFLKPAEDGLAQMAAALGERGDVGAVHILAHGSAGQLWLGGTFLDADTLAGQSEALAAIGRGMTSDGDLLVYACDMAKGEAGAQFVASLAQLTGADVAASNNRTGAGGDWQLEIRTGDVSALPVLAANATQQYHHDLATITVTNGNDTGAGSLRNAIAAATAGDTITFDTSRTVTLSSGQLTISKNLTIDGDLNDDGTADVTVDANNSSGVLAITTGTVTLDGLTITNGLLSGNGGDYNSVSGKSALGAGIAVTGGTVTIKNSVITANHAAGGGGMGVAIIMDTAVAVAAVLAVLVVATGELTNPDFLAAQAVAAVVALAGTRAPQPKPAKVAAPAAGQVDQRQEGSPAAVQEAPPVALAPALLAAAAAVRARQGLCPLAPVVLRLEPCISRPARRFIWHRHR